MDDQNNNSGNNSPYAGPPKAHNFQENLDVPSGGGSTMFKPPGSASTSTPTPAPTQQEAPLGPSYGGKPQRLGDLIQGQSAEEEEEANSKSVKKTGSSFQFMNRVNSFWIKRHIQIVQQKINDYKEEHYKALTIFNLVWMALMVAIYAGGASFFALFFSLYFKFTPILEGYLKERGLGNITFNITSHNLSEITLSDIVDHDGLFKIKTVKLQYSFINLLKKKIAFADVDSLSIYVKDSDEKGYNIDDFITFFQKIGIFDGKDGVKIQSIQMRNARLFIGNKGQQIPIDFSAIGNLDTKNQFVIPFNYNSDTLQASTKLTLTLSPNGTTWAFVLDNGRISLPNMPPESIKGTVTLKTKQRTFESLNAAFTLQKDHREKIVTFKVTPSKDKLVTIESTLTVSQGPKEKPFTAEVSLFNVEVGKSFRSIKTTDSFNVVLKNIRTDFLNIDSVQGNFIGALECLEMKCSYVTTQPSTVIFLSPAKRFYETNISSSHPVRMTLMPQKKPLFEVDEDKIVFDAMAQEGTFTFSKKDTRDEAVPITVSTKGTAISGDFDFKAQNGRLNIETGISSYKDNLVTLSDARLQTATTKEGTLIALNSPSVLLASDKMKVPFAIDVRIDQNQYFSAEVETNDRLISAKGSGYFNPYTGDFKTSVETNRPIVFQKDGIQPNDISSLFAKEITNLEGNIQLKGYVHFVNALNVAGPLHVLLENVSFDYANINVKNANSLLAVSSLIPFGTSQSQTAFIQSISTLLPFHGVNMTFYFDAVKKQLNMSRMTMNVAGSQLRVDPVWIPYQSPTQTFVFRDRAFDLDNLAKNIKTDGLTMKGKGTLALTTLLEDGNALIKNIEISIPGEGFIKYTPRVYPDEYLKAFENLEFREATIQMSELANGTVDVMVIAEHRYTKERRRTTLRFNVKQPLKDFLTPDKNVYEIPVDIFGQ